MDIKALFSKIPLPSIKTLVIALLSVVLVVAVLVSIQFGISMKKNTLTVLTEELYTDDLARREQAIVAIGLKGTASKDAIPDLLAMFRDANWLIRFRAVEALSNIGLPEAPVIAALTLETQDEVLDVRLKAIEAIANIGPASPEGLDALLRLTKDDERIIRKAAADAVLQMAERICQMRDYRRFIHAKPLAGTPAAGPEFRSIYNKTQIAKMEADAARREEEWKKKQEEKKKKEEEAAAKKKKAAPPAVVKEPSKKPTPTPGPPRETPEQKKEREAKELEQRLRDEETRESEEVAAILRECPDMMRDEYIPVRVTAIRVLAVLAEGFAAEHPDRFADLVPSLIRDLKDSDPNIVESSLDALGKIATEEAVQAAAYHKKYNP